MEGLVFLLVLGILDGGLESNGVGCGSGGVGCR
jgi:hypothetical protein